VRVKPLSVLQIGVGPMGLMIARAFAERADGFRLAGAVDTDPAKTGRDVGLLCGLGRSLGVRVIPGLRDGRRPPRADVAVIATASDLRRVAPLIEEAAGQGMAVVSTCEELVFPWKTAPALARRIDRAARQHGIAVLGTGVNPGFLMDLLPVALTAVCRRVDRVRVWRVQDARFRRIPFQHKIGAGLSLEAFEARRRTGALRHVGLTESMHLIAARMGWEVTRTEESLAPVVARRTIRTPGMLIRRGMAAGVEQVGRGFAGKEEKITLVFRASVGEPSPRDEVEIDGEPPIRSTIRGGVNGDAATVAIVLNAARAVREAAPGLRTMADLPVVSWRA